MSKSSQGIFTKSCRDFEEYLLSHKPVVDGFHPYFQQAFWEMVTNGGKRFRPSLLLCIVSAQASAFIKNSFDVCLALECLHTYSLIHDDLPSMDNARLRRGYPTLHYKYNETTAILVGDALNTYSFYLLSISKFSNDTKIAMIETLSYNGGLHGMIIGQALDCEFENTTLSQDKLDFIHMHKTAKLIATSLKLGGIIANLACKDIKLLYDFGLKLGLYFQIRDDILDSVQDEKQSLKTALNDANKNSYVNLLGLQEARDVAKEHAKALTDNLDSMGKSDLSAVSKNLQNLLSPYFKPL